MTEPAYDLVIRGGRVATASDVFEADVAVAGETIARHRPHLPAGGARSTRTASWFCLEASTATPISSNFRPPASSTPTRSRARPSRQPSAAPPP